MNASYISMFNSLESLYRRLPFPYVSCHVRKIFDIVLKAHLSNPSDDIHYIHWLDLAAMKAIHCNHLTRLVGGTEIYENVRKLSLDFLAASLLLLRLCWGLKAYLHQTVSFDKTDTWSFDIES